MRLHGESERLAKRLGVGLAGRRNEETSMVGATQRPTFATDSAHRGNGLVGCKEGRLPTYQQTSNWRSLVAWALIIVAFGVASLAIVLL